MQLLEREVFDVAVVERDDDVRVLARVSDVRLSSEIAARRTRRDPLESRDGRKARPG